MGLKYKMLRCRECGEPVAENWYVRHLKSGCQVGVNKAEAERLRKWQTRRFDQIQAENRRRLALAQEADALKIKLRNMSLDWPDPELRERARLLERKATWRARRRWEAYYFEPVPYE